MNLNMYEFFKGKDFKNFVTNELKWYLSVKHNDDYIDIIELNIDLKKDVLVVVSVLSNVYSYNDKPFKTYDTFHFEDLCKENWQEEHENREWKEIVERINKQSELKAKKDKSELLEEWTKYLELKKKFDNIDIASKFKELKIDVEDEID